MQRATRERRPFCSRARQSLAGRPHRSRQLLRRGRSTRPAAIDRLDHERVALGVVSALFCNKTHVVAGPLGDNPEAVMLDFVNPTLASGSLHDPGREAGPERIQHNG